MGWPRWVWHHIGGSGCGTFNGPPTAISSGIGVEVFGRGIDGHYYHDSYDGSAFHGWAPVGSSGQFISEPVVATNPNGGIDVFGQGVDWAYYHYKPAGAGWTLEAVDNTNTSTFDGPPQAAWVSGSALDVLGQGTDGAYYSFAQSNGAWGGVTALDGSGFGTVALTVPAAGTVDLFIEGTDHNPWEKVLQNGTWGGWSLVHGAYPLH